MRVVIRGKNTMNIMLALSVFITCMVMTAMITDMTSFIIPNLLVVVLLLTYPIVLFFAPVMPDWKLSLLIGFGTFVAGYFLFSIKAIGGGDVKLFAVLSLFVGEPSFPEFLMEVALLGGLLSVVLILARKMIAYSVSRFGIPAGEIPRLLKTGEPAPYGIAIGMAFLMLLWGGHVSGVTLS